MPTRVSFDNPTLGDAITKAGRIPPNKGPAFDKAGGIVLVVDPASKLVMVRSTDLDVTYDQHIYAQEASGDPVTWRIPASVITGLASQLHQGDGARTDFIDRGDSWIRFVSGNLKGRLALLPADDYPKMFEIYSLEGMSPAQDLAGKVEQVSWACDDKSVLMCGVHIDGNRIIGLSTSHFAMMPCQVPIDEPVTVPFKNLAQLIKSATDIRLRVEGINLLMMLDGETRTSMRVIEGNFPKLDGAILRENFQGKIKVHRPNLIETLNRLMVLVRNERIPTLRVEIGASGFLKQLTFDMDVESLGRMQDSIEVETDFADTFEIYFAPRMFLDALEHSNADIVEISFGVDDPSKDGKLFSLRITDDKGYICYLMPKKN